MKKRISISLILTMAISIFYNSLCAQRIIRTADATNDILTVNNTTVRVNNLFLIDSVDLSGFGQDRQYDAIMHRASFEIELGSPEATNILKTFYAAIAGKPLTEFVLQKINSTQQIVEERNFRGITVKEIVFPELNSESMETPKIKLTIQAQDGLYNDRTGGRNTKDLTRIRRAPGNRFRLTMGNLPTQRTLRISNFKMAPAKESFLYFNIDVLATDAKEWIDWLNASSRNPQNMPATISLMDETGPEILSIQFTEVEMVSVATLSSATGVSKTTIGLRTKQDPVVK